MNNLIIHKYLFVFLLMFITDVIWALYIRWSASGKAFRAAISSMFIFAVGAFTIGEFVRDSYIIIPAALGCFCGTFLTVKLDS